MTVALTLLAIAATVIAVTALAERFRISAPLLLVLVGIGASFVPFIAEPELSAEIVLFGLLPPLLYTAAQRTSVLDFRSNIRPIVSLSVLLVVVTALVVGVITSALLDVPFAVGFALGAVVAPPDAVAATSIARRVGMPRRLVSILEGESLVNDATAITCLRVGIVAITSAVSVVDTGLVFVVALLGGAAVGVVVAVIAVQIRRRLNEPTFDTAIALGTPFAAYVPAEAIHIPGLEAHGSGVIAVVVAGLIIGTKSPTFQSGQSRVSERVNWSTIQFLLENAVFLLIGLQARRIVTDARDDLPLWTTIGFCAAVLATVIVVRVLWVLGSRFFLFRHRGRQPRQLPKWSHMLVIGWAGLRGVVTLAAVFLIPEDVEHRPALVLAALVVVAGTLLIQGGTLPALVRLVGLRGPDPRADALQAATVLESATRVALAKLDEIAGEDNSPETVEMLRQRLLSRPHALWEKLGHSDSETPAEEYRRLRIVTLRAERDEVLRIRRTGSVESDVIEDVLSALDIEESMIAAATERSENLSAEPLTAPIVAPEGMCEHLEAAPYHIEPNGPPYCVECERDGTNSVHLRICLTCGHVGCCDSSLGRHAERHFQESGHLVMRSFEKGEKWRWCYLDERIG